MVVRPDLALLTPLTKPKVITPVVKKVGRNEPFEDISYIILSIERSKEVTICMTVNVPKNTVLKNRDEGLWQNAPWVILLT